VLDVRSVAWFPVHYKGLRTEGGDRTHTSFRTLEFESSAAAITPPRLACPYQESNLVFDVRSVACIRFTIGT
jgi:hypothetical protein